MGTVTASEASGSFLLRSIQRKMARELATTVLSSASRSAAWVPRSFVQLITEAVPEMKGPPVLGGVRVRLMRPLR